MIGVLDKNRFGLALKKKGIHSILELCRYSGIHRNTLFPYLRGEKSIYSNAILDLVNFLDVDPENLRADVAKKPDAFVLKLTDNFHQHFSSRYPDLAVLLFGSRAKGKARKFSDYDLGVTAGSKIIATKDFLEMKEFILSQSDNFAWKVDLANLDEAPSWFLADLGVEPTKLLIGSSQTYHFLKGRAYECHKSREARYISE